MPELVILERNKTEQEAKASVKIGASIRIESILKNRSVEVILPIMRGG